MSSWWIAVPVFCTALYSGFLGWCILHWRKRLPVQAAEDFNAPRVTVVVAVRDEATSIARTIADVAAQDYPADRFELLLVDDGSTDGTAEVAAKAARSFQALRCRILTQTDGGSKKAAIETAVVQAEGDWIVTTDGDVTLGSQWLAAMMQPAASPGVKLICGPVVLSPDAAPTVFSRAAVLESVGLTAIAAAGIQSGHPFFCNGANLAYPKTHFLSAGGYSTSRHRLSGDDTDLLRATDPSAIRYVKAPAAVVRANAPASLGAFFSQRQRWASKIPGTLSIGTFIIALLAWCCHAGLLSSAVLFLFSDREGWAFLAGAWLMKWSFEAVLLKVSGRFLEEKISLSLLLLLQPLYALALIVIGIAAVTRPYRWKGRKSR